MKPKTSEPAGDEQSRRRRRATCFVLAGSILIVTMLGSVMAVPALVREVLVQGAPAVIGEGAAPASGGLFWSAISGVLFLFLLAAGMITGGVRVLWLAERPCGDRWWCGGACLLVGALFYTAYVETFHESVASRIEKSENVVVYFTLIGVAFFALLVATLFKFLDLQID